MTRGCVLSLFDESAVMVRPWVEAGYEAICVDLAHEGDSTRDGVRFIGADIRRFIPPLRRYAAIFAFPPCTDLAVSGARWFREKGLTALVDALALVDCARRICEASDAPWMLENPVSTISSYWRAPDLTFDPCEFAGFALEPDGDAYTKRTCLWTGNGFRLPTARPVSPVMGSRMHRLPPSHERARLRSKTPDGFARAVFAANQPERIAA